MNIDTVTAPSKSRLEPLRSPRVKVETLCVGDDVVVRYPNQGDANNGRPLVSVGDEE